MKVSDQSLTNSKNEKKMEKKFQTIHGLKMAYTEEGKGEPIVFLHGNPTSSYIWRNIIPYVQDFGRCIAPDLMGMGDSDKFPDSASNNFSENQKYLEALLESLQINKNILFVVHDWGSALAFDWARRHPGAVRGIVYMEAILKPRTWAEISPTAQTIFKNLRSEKGEEMVLQQNSFIEGNLPKTVLRQLSKEEMDEYRRPFQETGEGRRAMLSWARQLPIEGQPANIEKIVNAYGDFLSHSTIPKLFIEGSPGTLSEKDKLFCRTWPNQIHIKVKGHHNLQEDSPDEIGTAISVWIQGLNPTGSLK
ncbi:haloalkane dehalogenase [Flavitalea flava]